MKCCIDDRECNNCHNCDFWSLSDSEIQNILPNEFYEDDTSYDEIDDYLNLEIE